MEVKIKTDGGMVDATIEMIDGVMVVSPVNVFKPQDGDIVATEDGEYIGIFKRWEDKDENQCQTYCVLDTEDEDQNIEPFELYIDRFATGKEKRLLFDRIEKNGFKWDAEAKALRRMTWEPAEGETFYRILLSEKVFSPQKKFRNNDFFLEEVFKHEIVFKTEEACQSVCEQMNSIFRTMKQ